MSPNLASGLKRKRTKEQKASEEVERVRGWVKAAVENSDAFIGQSLLKPMDGVVGELLKDIGQSLGVKCACAAWLDIGILPHRFCRPSPPASHPATTIIALAAAGRRWLAGWRLIEVS